MLATMMASAILRSPPLLSNHINQPGGIRMCVNTAPTNVPAVSMTEEARQLADMIGVSLEDAKRIMRFCPISCQPDALLSVPIDDVSYSDQASLDGKAFLLFMRLPTD